MDKLEAAKIVDELIALGETFTYENFSSSKSQYGYPNSLKPEWIAFTTRCTSIVRKLFGEDSPADKTLNAGLAVRILGNDRDNSN
jgi:hypothetical protein